MRTIIFLLFIVVLTGCNEEEQDATKVTGYEEYVITVASQKLQGIVDAGTALSDMYAVKKEASQNWQPLFYVQDFDYESGYEYVIRISETNYLDYTRGTPAWSEYKLIEVISKEQKSSEGLPGNFVPDGYIDK